MIYRRFGKTGFDVPVLSAGFMRSMHSWQSVPESGIPVSSQRNLEEILRSALELGVNHFETANAYGSSEEQLGRALRDIPRHSYLLQTKVQPEANPKKFVQKVEQSLNRLGLAHVDLLAIHGINDYQTLWQVCRKNGCLAASRSLQQQGKVGAVGFSGHAPVDVIVEAIRHQENNGFDYVNLHWYYIYQVNNRALAEAAKQDMGVFVISPTDKGGMLHDSPETFSRLCEPLVPMAFNDVFCLSRPEIHTLSVGAARPSDFSTHVEALEHIGSEELVEQINTQCCKAMVNATGFTRPEALWEKLPPWEKTPGLINIRFVLWLFNLARGWGLVTYARQRYHKLGRDVKWVPGNNGAGAGKHDLEKIAEGVCMQNDELVSLLEEAHDLLAN